MTQRQYVHHARVHEVQRTAAQLLEQSRCICELALLPAHSLLLVSAQNIIFGRRVAGLHLEAKTEFELFSSF